MGIDSLEFLLDSFHAFFYISFVGLCDMNAGIQYDLRYDRSGATTYHGSIS